MGELRHNLMARCISDNEDLINVCVPLFAPWSSSWQTETVISGGTEMDVHRIFSPPFSRNLIASMFLYVAYQQKWRNRCGGKSASWNSQLKRVRVLKNNGNMSYADLKKANFRWEPFLEQQMSTNVLYAEWISAFRGRTSGRKALPFLLLVPAILNSYLLCVVWSCVEKGLQVPRDVHEKQM